MGFPFALRIACRETAVAEASTGTKANLAGATGGVSVLSPMTARIFLEAPARAESPLLEGPAEFRWEEAAINVGLGVNGPRDASFDAEEFSAIISVSGIPEQTATAADIEGTLAPSAGGGSDLAVAFTDFTLASAGKSFPPLTGTAAGELSVPPRALASGRAGLSAPLWVRAIEIDLESQGARFLAEGDISVDAEGILDGAMTLRIAGVEALPVFIAALPTEWQKIANAVTGGPLRLRSTDDARWQKRDRGEGDDRARERSDRAS